MSSKTTFEERLSRHIDELKWLYFELYSGRDDREKSFSELLEKMSFRFNEREDELKKLDEERLCNKDWYKGNSIVGMMLYTEAFAGNLKGVRKKLDYIEECKVNYIHLMPLLDTPKTKNDGGYAVSDFRKVREDLGTMEDLSELSRECRRRGISLCLDFVMNHTSNEHEWAKRALRGEKEYKDRYFFFEDYSIPARFEETCPQVFPQTAPGNFTRIEETGEYVMTTFYPYQWDLNYGNPAVLTEMTDCLLNLTNKGVDVIRIDAVPYIWKEIGTNCRNLKQVHSIVRMIRMICEVVCPGVLLLGEVVMEPDKVAPYFGTVEKPECHMLYNVTTMASTWHSLAVKDVSLIRKQLDTVNSLPKEYTFLNYLRCHDDIGWGLDYEFLKSQGMEEIPHKKFLNDFFTGRYEGSFSRGELYNDDPVLMDARLCGTTASLCGIEAAKESGDKEQLSEAVDRDLMLHGFMLFQSGIPVIYSGDEVAELNDYSYKDDPKKADDSRYVHRGAFNWRRAAQRKRKGTVENRIFEGISRMLDIRREHKAFLNEADVRTLDSGDASVLCIERSFGDESITALFNFSPEEKIIKTHEDAKFYDLISGESIESENIVMPPLKLRWMLKINQ